MSEDNLTTETTSDEDREEQYINEFQMLPENQQINYLAHLMYETIHVDPYGFPSGMPLWDELPLVDHDHKLGVDQIRYIDAATAVRKLLTRK